MSASAPRVLLDDLRVMLAHCAARGVSIGPYWSAICPRIIKQLELEGSDDWYSSSVSYASSFAGAPYNGARDLARESEASWGTLLARKTENLLARLPVLGPLADPLWRRTFDRKRSAYYLHASSASYEMLVRSLYALLEKDVVRLDLSSPDDYGPDLVEAGGRKLAYKTLIDLSYFLRLQEVLSARSRTFVEIGAGVGELARIFLASGRADRYVIVDIPPALAYSQRMLSTQFPPHKLSFFDPARARVDFGSDALCYFLTPDQLGLLPSVDAGLNLFSFGEMTPAIVSSYVSALKASGLGEFASINHRLRKGHNAEVVGEREYESYFAPTHRVARRASYPADRPVLELPADEPGRQGYQLLHFTRP